MKKFLVAVSVATSLFSSAFAGSAPAAYFWDIAGIASQYAVDTDGISRPLEWENVGGSRYSTLWNHEGVTYAVVLVGGYSNGVPVTVYNGGPMSFLWSEALDVNGDNIIDGWYYYYGTNSYVSNGNVEIKDWSGSSYGTRDSIFVK